MDDPITTLIDQGNGILGTFDVGMGKPYDPTDDATYAPNNPTTPKPTAFGLFQMPTDTGVAWQAEFIIKAADKPAGLLENQSKVAVNGAIYTIVGIRKRVYEGAINGYQLGLKA